MAIPADQVQVVGYYTQPYNELVHPARIWRVSKYFLRRWGPYLTPSRFWAVVAARQLAYWQDKSNSFSAYDKRFAQEARLSTVHLRRLKAEMSVADQPLSLFLTQKEVAKRHRYHVVGGQTKPKPTTYYLRLDDPLTPADAHHLAIWLRQEAPQGRTDEVTAVLRAARDLPRAQLFAPHLAYHLADKPAQFQYISVLEVVKRVYGPSLAQRIDVKEAAEGLHAHLTDPDYYGKEYFRVQWLNRLKPGPAFLITYLRSLCFHDETTGELRNEITFTRPELANRLGVTTKTVVNWLDKLANSVPEQAIGAFLTLLAQERLSNNDVRYRYKIEMLEPLTPEDLVNYQGKLTQLDLNSVQIAQGKNDHHRLVYVNGAEGKNDGHDSQALGKNDHHGQVLEGGGQGNNDHHDIGQEENLIMAERKNENGSRKKRWPYKYYKILTQTLTDNNLNSLLRAADCYHDWRTDHKQALQPFAQAISGNDAETLFDLIEVDRGGPSRQRMQAGGLAISEMVAWYLYSQSQPGLSKPPVHMTVARTQTGMVPPPSFLTLANLSWELWRCYACLLVAPPTTQFRFHEAPHYDLWMRHYGRFHPDALPFAVGRGVSETVNVLLYTEEAATLVPSALDVSDRCVPHAHPCVELQSIWQPVLQELGLSMTKATYNSWLKDTLLLEVDIDDQSGLQQWTVGVGNQYGVDWLTNRLNKTVIEPVATAVCGQPISISYVVV